MGYVRRRLKAWKSSLEDAFKKTKLNKKLLSQLAAIAFLFLISIFVYIKISTNNGGQLIAPYSSKILNDAINQYRLENYPRAEMLFKKIIEERKNKNEVSVAFLFLGNLMYEKNQLDLALDYYKKVYSNKKIGKYAYYNSAVVELKKGKINNAIKDVKHGLKCDKLFMEADLLLGNLYYLKGDYNRALQAYNRHQYNPVFLFNKAMASISLGKIESAEKTLLNLVIRKDVEKVIKGLSYYELGNIFVNKSFKKASYYYYQAYKLFNQNENLLYNASVLMAKSGNYRKAANFLLAHGINELSDKEKEAYGYIFFKANYYKRAINILSTIKSKIPETDIILGNISLKNGDIKGSEKYFSLALENAYKDQQKIFAYNGLIMLYQKAGMLDRALEVCSNLDETTKNNCSILISCAKNYFEKKEDEKALLLMSKALNKAENNKSKLFQIALVYFKYGYIDNALKVFYKIRDLYSDDYRSLLGIAKVFSDKGQKERALNVLNLIIKGSRDIDIYYESLILKAENVNYSKAENIYKGLIRDFPYRYEAYYNLARLYLLNKNYEESNKLIDYLLSGGIKIPKDILLQSYIIKGIALYKIGKNAEAYRAFKSASRIDENNEIVRVNLSLLEKMNK